jgi:glycosyltransferase involved in cell wall biosynthesis
VVAAARIFPLKDIETMIRSAAVARELIPDIRYLVYGSLDADVPYVRRCQALVAELGLENTFELRGFHSNPAELYSEGDVCVLSSISEAFPYTALESMACARPVVGTDVGGVREALEGFGIVVPPRDPEAIGRAVVSLVADDEFRRELGRRAREEVLAKYRTSDSVNAYWAAYCELTTPAVAKTPALVA